jgi:hypothetical protein
MLNSWLLSRKFEERLRHVSNSQVCRADSQIDEARGHNQTKPTAQGTPIDLLQM